MSVSFGVGENTTELSKAKSGKVRTSSPQALMSAQSDPKPP